MKIWHFSKSFSRDFLKVHRGGGGVEIEGFLTNLCRDFAAKKLCRVFRKCLTKKAQGGHCPTKILSNLDTSFLTNWRLRLFVFDRRLIYTLVHNPWDLELALILWILVKSLWEWPSDFRNVEKNFEANKKPGRKLGSRRTYLIGAAKSIHD